MNKLIDNIESYLSDISIYYKDMNSELLNAEIGRSFSSVEGIINYFKDEIEYSIDKYEIHCRALRDRLENE